MDDIQERLEHYEGKDRERKEREAEMNPLTISQLIKVLKEVKKQAGNLPVRYYTGKDKDKVYTHLCKEPTEIKIMEDRDREKDHGLRKFALIK